MISPFLIPYSICDFQFENFRINSSTYYSRSTIYMNSFPKKKAFLTDKIMYLLMYALLTSAAVVCSILVPAAILATCARKYKWWPAAGGRGHIALLLSERWVKSIQKCPINLAQRTYRRASHVHKLIENQPTPL